MREIKFYKIGATVLIILVALIIVFMVLGKKSDKQLAETESQEPTSVSSSNVIEQENSLNDINALEEIKTTSTEQSSQENNNTTVFNQNIERTENKNEDIVSTSTTDNNESNNEAEVVHEEPVDPVFKYPVDGEIIMEYAKDKLVYSNTLDEWITHLGVDIKADKTTIVKASAAGTVKSIKNDPRYGLTVIMEHVNGYTTVYSNLLTAEFVSVGEAIAEGQTIGTVGNIAPFEILEEPHLHFEILQNGEQIDPTMYLKN